MVAWMETRYARNFTTEGVRSFRVWVTDPSWCDETSEQPDAFGVERAVQEIESGVYHAIVVVDYSNSEQFGSFEEHLAPHIQKFVQQGGVAAFPSSEGALLSTFEKFFHTTWKQSGYYRTNWGPCTENMLNINHSFGNGHLSRGVIRPYSAKSVSFKNVPAHERCFGVTSESRTQSLVPMMDGLDVSTGPDYDVNVAMHNFGNGCVAYFGDVNCEEPTIRLVEAFCLSRCPKHPINCFGGLDSEVFEEAEILKERGNAAFRKGDLSGAEEFYRSAAGLYGPSTGTAGPQRGLWITLHSNLALVHFRAKEWEKSETSASRVLEVDDGHEKALFRRASARYELGNIRGDMSILRAAEQDLTRMPFSPTPDKANAKLMDKIRARMKRLETKQKERFRKNFAGAL